MNADAKGLHVSIMGREFRVACEPGEQKALLEAVAYLNRKMQEIKEQGKINRHGTRRDHGRAQHLARIPDDAARQLGLSEFRRRMSGIETTLDQALADQEKLF